MVNRKTGKIVPVPFHKGRDVGVGLIREIISEVGVTPEEWLAL
jgi:predicted RNA binding protein YcfA (HicA-like mRNA interferase family)